MKKVLHYIPSIDYSSGGTTTYMQLLAKGLGVYVDLHIVTHPSENPVIIENVTLHYLQGSLMQIQKVKKQWQNLLNTLCPEIVHVNCCWLPFCALTQKWAQQLGYKVVLTPHGMLEPWIMQRHHWTKKVPALLLYQKEAIKKADIIHATAELEKKNLLQLGHNKNIHVIPNGIEVDAIEIKSSWDSTKKLLFLSRVHVKKGIELLLEAASRLKNQMEDYSIIIAGEGDKEYIEQLKRTAKELEVDSIFQFIGGVYGEKKWALFQEADFFILPTHSENFGIVIAEALASGIPVITTKGTPWNELNSLQCGWWIDNSVNILAETIMLAINTSKEDRKLMGKRGRKLIEENYSIKIVAKKMLQLYQSEV